jgi:UDP-sulfoquinovose synthase
MRILILGMDGYIGWCLSMHLALRGHVVCGIDNFSRRRNVESVNGISAFPILKIEERIDNFRRIHKKDIFFYQGDLLDYNFIAGILKETHYDCIVHLGEQPSAPFSMLDRDHAVYTQRNNVEGNLNVLFGMKEYARSCHLVKLGTLGEYGTPNIPIPEGMFEVTYRGKKDVLPFPKRPGSIYHLSKVHDSNNVDFACRVWGLSATDVMQGIVYGSWTPEIIEDSLNTRFDFDEFFGTVLNRYCAQAVIGHPLTPYGKGKQKRGFIDLIDSVQCLRIAVENPAPQGEYRVFNQLSEIYDITELAKYVAEACKLLGLPKPKIIPISNPRKENEANFYDVENISLRNLGFRPTRSVLDSIIQTLKFLMKYRNRILDKEDTILPKAKWDNQIHNQSLVPSTN